MSLTKVSFSMINGAPVNVLDYGADPTGVSDCATAFALAVAALPTTGGTLYIPDGNYTYTGGLIFNYPVSLVMGENAFMNYTGTGNAVQLGALGKSAIDISWYYVTGGVFTNGDDAVHGIYIPAWVGYPTIENVRFEDFGNTDGSSWGIFAQSQNWLVKVFNCTHQTGLKKSSFCAAAGFISGLGFDFGSSQLFASGNNCLSSAAGGQGILTTGAGSQITGNKIEGRNPNITISSFANSSTITNNYFESLTANTVDSNPGHCIEFTYDGAFAARGLVIENNYCNLHQTDFGNTGSFVAPQDMSAFMLECTVNHNSFGACNTAIPVVKLNNIVNQNRNSGIGNNAAGNGFPVLRSDGSNIFGWAGEEPHIINLGVGVSTETGGSNPRTAKAQMSVDRIVTFSGYIFATSTTIPAGTGLATVPSGYVPNRQVATLVFDEVTGTTGVLTISILGVISLSVNLTSSSVLSLESVTYSIQ